MAKENISSSFAVYLALTLALLLLLLLASLSPSRPRFHQPHRRLKLRSSFSFPSDPSSHSSPHPPIPFDPLISDLERRREDREWERAHDQPAAPGHEGQPEWEDFMDAEDYINDEDRFNVTHRIEMLFPKIDVAPKDGFVTVEELTQWNVEQASKEVMHRTKREMELHDKDKDGFVAFKEYEAPSWARKADDDNTLSDDLGWWKEDHFNASDVDGNGLLNLTEFNEERDKDKDGKLDFKEFFNGLFESLRNYDEVYNQSDTSEAASAKKLFQQLDQDRDGFLSEDELKHVIGNLHPSEHYYAKQQADYVLSQFGIRARQSDVPMALTFPTIY